MADDPFAAIAEPASAPAGGFDSTKFDTKLSPDEEKQFATWKQTYAPKDSGYDYDLRGAFKTGLKPDPKTGHWPDTFKKPNHPTFSNESQYAKSGNPGHWEGEKFVPGSGAADPFASIAEPVSDSGDNTEKTPGFFKRLVAPPGPDAGFLESAGATLLGTPGAIYHAFADEPTEEEKARYAPGEKAAGEEPGAETSGLKRVGLGVRRLTVDPITGANLGDYTSGKITPRAAASVLPEAIGTGIGSVAAGEVMGKVGETVKKATPGEFKGFRPFARRVTDVETGLTKEVKTEAEGYTDKLAKNKEARRDVFQENMRKQSEANFDIGRDKLAVEQENKRIAEENKAAEEQVAKRAETLKQVDQQSAQLGERIGKVEESVHKTADAKFDKVRAKIGNAETEPAPLIESVRSAEENILQGIPENIKEFRSILGHGEEAPLGLEDAFREVTGEEPEGPLPITWDKLQSLKSRIDARLRARGRMNGDLKRALYSVQNSIVDTMGDMAEEAGAHDLWTDAKDTWRQYKEDFHETAGKGGSPVARAREGVDPADIRQPFLGKSRSTIKNRGVEILRKYPQHGGNEAAAAAENLVKTHDAMGELPKKATPKALKEPEQVHDMPARKQAPPVPEKPTVDAAKVARDVIAQKAKNWANFNARDIGILGSSVIAGTLMHVLGGRGLEAPAMAVAYEGMKYASGRVLAKPSVIEWLSQTPPEEMAALNKIPGADKVNIINAITQQAIQETRMGRLRQKYGVPSLSPAAKQLLGPSNVARILGTGAGVKNRKDALDLLNDPAALSYPPSQP